MSLYSVHTVGQLEPYLGQEWLLTNGIGSYASGTVVGCNTRRYHGLLCAATKPPVGRVMTLNRMAETVYLDNNLDRLHELSLNQFGSSFHPRGEKFLRFFEVNGVARWKYLVDGVSVIKELQILWQQNTIALRYRIEMDRPRPVELHLTPFFSMRDFHSLRRAEGYEPQYVISQRNLLVRESDVSLTLSADAGKFVEKRDWWFGHTYDIESERGLDDTEDLFTPGSFTVQAFNSTTVTIVASTDPSAKPVDWNAELSRRTLATGFRAPKTQTQERLFRAANDFVVRRKSPDGSDGSTILAGYPWFADWGRDTMISLPGLLLCTNRFKEAAQVLTVFAAYVSEGMIPNRFDDYTNEPHYNTVDASLWFIHACFEYLRASEDKSTFESKLLPACHAIIEGYKRGTRYDIHMDPRDGLIVQGNPQTQLTWMDAKCGEIAFTPRQGKAVEINALWYHALRLLNNPLADQVQQSFKKAFWLSPFRGLADVMQDGNRDAKIRPNQIFAVSLAHSPLSEPQQRSVVEVVRRELLTPLGLRTLSASDPGYVGQYAGNQKTRDKAYHNGTVWAWLIGPFLEAYLRTNGRSEDAKSQAREWLQPLVDSLESGCIGNLSECFEGDAPHRPVGCFAQAWSVAEVLRIALELEM